MNARKAKAIRRLVYGKGTHPGPVTYRTLTNKQIRADNYRQVYQDTKRGNK